MKLSILNLAPVREGQTYLQAVESMVNLAKHAENIGIERYWIAEHHNMKNLVSSATALLIQQVNFLHNYGINKPMKKCHQLPLLIT